MLAAIGSPRLGPMLKAEPVRRLLRLGKAPAGVFGAAVVLADEMLDTGRGPMFRLGQSDFVAHEQQ